MQTAKELKNHKRRLKSHLTPQELYVLKQLGVLGINFKYQIILGFYIMDFILPDKMVNIEVDGGVHDTSINYDKNRDNFTRKCGFSIIRIRNNDIYSFDYKSILLMPNFDISIFRRGLALGNCYRGKAISKQT
jgi:very-short-patch-repair endonuclease